MPWKERHIVDERMRFALRYEEGERMSDLCREFGIARKTGYKFLKRYKEYGVNGLSNQSRSPHHHPNRTPKEIIKLILAFKERHPTWGARKLEVELTRRHAKIKFPAHSTIHELLNRYGLVHNRRRWRRTPIYEGELTQGYTPNEVWCADFKGQFRMGNRIYCYPLTISDHFSRYLIGCEGLERPNGSGARQVFESAFKQHGLPKIIRTDNGAPFASRGIAGLSRLSVWFIRLGIRLERIKPGHPEQNGRHERMHLTLKQETTRPAGANMLQQQERFDRFIEEYNTIRPHEAIDMKYPADLYTRSERSFPEELPSLDYPLHDLIRKISAGGHVQMFGRRGQAFVGQALAGEMVGLRETESGRWLLTFSNLDLGHIDEKNCVFESLTKKVLPMSPG